MDEDIQLGQDVTHLLGGQSKMTIVSSVAAKHKKVAISEQQLVCHQCITPTFWYCLECSKPVCARCQQKK